VSVLSAVFPGANCATGREIVIDLVSATARAADGLPAFSETTPGGIGFGQRLILHPKPGRRYAQGRIPPTSKSRRFLDHRKAPSKYTFHSIY
jgi:hypothetical protein